MFSAAGHTPIVEPGQHPSAAVRRSRPAASQKGLPRFRLAVWALFTAVLLVQPPRSPTQVRFNACQALHELQRLGLVVRVPGATAAAAPTSTPLPLSHTHASGCDLSGLPAGSCQGAGKPPQDALPPAAGDGTAAGCARWRLTGLGPGCMEDPVLGCDGHDGCACGGGVWWAAVPLRDAVPVVEDHWAGLLWRRVDTILRQRDEA